MSISTLSTLQVILLLFQDVNPLETDQTMRFRKKVEKDENYVKTVCNLSNVSSFAMERNSVHFFVALLSLSLFFPPSKKKSHRTKRERAVVATKNAWSSVSCSFSIIDESYGLAKRRCDIYPTTQLTDTI